MKRGFTLIELMIAVVLTGLLVNGGLAAYRGVGERQKVKQAGISFQTNLKSYQQKALAGEKPDACADPDTLSGYRVMRISLTSYSVRAICDTAVPAAVAVNLDEGIKFSSNFNVFFPVLGGPVTGATAITLQNADASYNYQVTVESLGVIRGETVP